MPHIPFWFKQRQGKAEAVGADLLRVTAPNLGEAFVGVKKSAEGQWEPVFRVSMDGENLASQGSFFATSPEAWDAAFEHYRESLVV